MKWLTNRKTYLGSFALALLGAIWSIDLVVHGRETWLPEDAYTAIGTAIAGLTGAALRLAVSKANTHTQGDAR